MKAKEAFAIITVSRQGVEKALEIKELIPEKNPDIYTMEKYGTKETRLIRGKIGDFFGELMSEYDTIICIMATGIVVRSIADHLGHKSKDPGILVVDQAGRFVISLLSGHLGHANENAITLAKRMGAEPVITTGTDVKGSLAVDVLAEKLECTIGDFTAAKDVTALILDDEPVGVINDENCESIGLVLPKNLSFITREEAMTGGYGGFVITSIKDKIDFETNKPIVQIVPRKIVV
ncbi:MAG: cobalamin biosynthesis central domain-containing protein, partial [Eubacterium sp.]